MSTVAASSLIWTISRTYTQPDGKSSGALSFLQQSQHREETIWENNEPVKRHQLLCTYCILANENGSKMENILISTSGETEFPMAKNDRHSTVRQ